MDEIKKYFKQVAVQWLLNVVCPLTFMREVADRGSQSRHSSSAFSGALRRL